MTWREGVALASHAFTPAGPRGPTVSGNGKGRLDFYLFIYFWWGCARSFSLSVTNSHFQLILFVTSRQNDAEWVTWVTMSTGCKYLVF